MQGACQPLDAKNAIAPAWHLRVLLCVLLLAPLAGLASGVGLEPLSGAGSQIGELYAPLVLANVGFAAYVSRVGLGANKLEELLGRAEASDVLLGFALGALLLGGDAALVWISGSPESLAGHALLPRTSLARLCWLLVAVSTAFSEELVYRGYLRRQFELQSRSAIWGNVAQAALFGIAHGAQGPSAVLRFSLYGIVFGIVAGHRRGLLAVVVCHAALDLYAGLSG